MKDASLCHDGKKRLLSVARRLACLGMVVIDVNHHRTIFLHLLCSPFSSQSGAKFSIVIKLGSLVISFQFLIIDKP